MKGWTVPKLGTLVVSERSSLSKAGQRLLLTDADLMPELRDRGTGDADGCAYLAHEVDGVGVTLAVGVVDLSAPECACLVTPLGDGLDGWLLGVTHGSFSLGVEREFSLGTLARRV